MMFDVFVDSDGIAVLTITHTDSDHNRESVHRVMMALGEASALADQISAAVRDFPGSRADSPAWFEAH